MHTLVTVKNMKKSREFYQTTLGFEVEWGSEDEDTICSVARDGQSIMLTEDPISRDKGCIWIGLEDDSLFKTCKDKGVKVVLEPRNMPWAYEMKIEDEDGNLLWLGTEPKIEEPPKT